MLKINRKSLKRGNTILINLDKEKVLTLVGAFFIVSMRLIISRMFLRYTLKSLLWIAQEKLLVLTWKSNM